MSPNQVRQTTAARRRRPLTTIVSFLLALAVMVLAGASVSASDGNRPTIVLVHGGWAGPGSWSQVVGRLNHDGFAIVTPTLGLDTLAGDVAIVQQALDSIPGKKVLVG